MSSKQESWCAQSDPGDISKMDHYWYSLIFIIPHPFSNQKAAAVNTKMKCQFIIKTIINPADAISREQDGQCKRNLNNLMTSDANKTYKMYNSILLSHKNHCKTQIIQ